MCIYVFYYKWRMWLVSLQLRMSKKQHTKIHSIKMDQWNVYICMYVRCKITFTF
jgi:hypothetical protein